MEIKTENLVIKTFGIELIDAAINKDYKKIIELGFYVNDDWPEPDLLDALPFFRDLLTENGENGFNSWLITDIHTSEILGSAGFIGEPDNNGTVEIGFGILPSYRRKGYCVQSVAELIKWAFNQNDVRKIIAKCETTNSASIAVLSKLGFTQSGREDELLVWELCFDTFNFR